ncbi:hypothetical protein evm_007179 [Chilo suppressalis]|nr:hypothetical protein evm_007179 [Chilo suppressalis]
MTSLFSGALRSVVAGFPEAAAGHGASEKAIAAALAHDLDLFVEIYHRLDPAMFGERDITQMSWAQVVAEAWIMECSTAVLRQTGWDAPQHHWDFVTVTLCAITDNLYRAKHHTDNTKVAMIAHSALKLYTFVNEFISHIPHQCTRRMPSQHVAALPHEWRDVFSPALHRNLYALAAHILDSSSKSMTYNKSRVMISLSRAIRLADWNLIDSAHKNSSLQLSVLVEKCGQALAQPLHPLVHCLAHATLIALASPLADYDAEKLSSWSVEGPEGSSSRPVLAPDWFQPHLTRALQLTDEILSPYTAGLEACVMQPDSDSHGLALGALLLSDALYELSARAKQGLAHHYTQMLRWLPGPLSWVSPDGRDRAEGDEEAKGYPRDRNYHLVLKAMLEPETSTVAPARNDSLGAGAARDEKRLFLYQSTFTR